MTTRPSQFPVAAGPPPLHPAPPAHRLPQPPEQYTITNLESYGRPKPIKPTKEAGAYPPPTSSPPKLMNLDAPTAYPQAQHYDRYPHPGARYPSKAGSGPIMSPSPNPPGYAPIHRPEFARAEYGRPADMHQRSFPGHRNYYPQAAAAPFQPAVDPRHPMYRNPVPNHPQSGHRAPHYDARPSQGHTGPPPGYYPHAPHHNPELPPGYYGHPHASPYPGNQGPGAPHGSGFGPYGPVPPPGMPPAHYAAFYAAAAAGSPNGAFMIQNILQANAAAGDAAPAAPPAATSH
jgi:hypothetical protein